MKLTQFPKEFGDIIYQARRKMGLSQLELSRKMKVSRASIANIECGRQQLYLHQLIEFCYFFGIKTKEMLAIAEQEAIAIATKE